MTPNSATGVPWLTIWTEPRRTIRQIVDRDPSYGVLLIAALAGALSTLEARWMAMPAHPPGTWPLFVAISAGLGALLGIVALYIDGFLLRLTGAMLGGVANYAEVRAALAWSEIPAIAAVVIGIVAVLLGVAGPMTPGMSPMARRASGLEVLHLVLGAWSFVVTLKCLGEVHRFSAWRALGSIVVLILAIAVVIFVLIMAGVSIGRLMHPATTI